MQCLTPKETATLLRDNPEALFIDCRSEREFRFVGHPTGARHVPWNEDPGWDINPNFVGAVRKLASDARDRPVVLICRDGERSAQAGAALEGAGFTRVYGVRHGFEGDVGPNYQRGGVNGWRFDSLPWELSACADCRS
jgi:rhodanese-related sulfurtransferase